MEEKGFRFLNLQKLKYQTSSEKSTKKENKEYDEGNLEEENFNACQCA